LTLIFAFIYIFFLSHPPNPPFSTTTTTTTPTPIHRQPFCALRDYLLFITVFLGFLYCGRSSDAYWLKTGLLSSLGGATTFDNLATTSQLFDYLKDEFLPASFPQQGPSETGELSCKQKQFLGDGVHVRVGNMRLRQIRVGDDEAPKRKWSSALLHK